jgi:starch-binding outer membrane protein, SusD/RagB family
MKRYTTIALALSTVVAAACKDNAVTNPVDAPTVDALAGALTRTSLQTLVTGVTGQDRAGFATTTVLILSEIFARDAYRIDASEPRYVNETLSGQPDPGSFAGGGGWTNFYVATRAANNIILAIPSASGIEFTNAEKSAALGFLRTLKALDYYRVVEMRDSIGIALQTDNAAEVTAIRCKTAVLTYIAALLDSANADFTAAGGTTKVPFTLPGGYTNAGRDYSLVSNLVRLNRGLKGKVDLYRVLDHQNPTPALAATAVTELTQALGGVAAGAVPVADFTKGAYYNFVPGGSENFANLISDDKIGLHPLLRDSVQIGDTRGSKIVNRAAALTGQGLSTSITYSLAVPTAANQAAPIGILRDEELVLLRAQANVEAGNLPTALLDVNSVRANYGLLPIAVFADKTSAINAILYEKRFSLLFEGPQRMVDLRAYSRLSPTYFRLEFPTDPFNKAFPIPKGEADARGGAAPACTA